MGAGVQTSAMLIKYYKEYDYIIFADTGDELPETYEYIEKYLKPFCEEHNANWITVRHPKYDSLMDWSMDKKILPMRSTRQCTKEFKVFPIQRFVRKHGARIRDPCIMDIGFSIDESHRLGNDKHTPKYIKKNYPLLDDKLSRKDCEKIITDFGWPIPAKSGCDFCPFKRWSEFKKLWQERPERFKEVVAMEKNDRGYPNHTLKDGHKLESIMLQNTNLNAFGFNDGDDPEDDMMCDEGHCMT